MFDKEFLFFSDARLGYRGACLEKRILEKERKGLKSWNGGGKKNDSGGLGWVVVMGRKEKERKVLKSWNGGGKENNIGG
jgi:hypothetical protein